LYYYPSGVRNTVDFQPITINPDEHIQELRFPDHMIIDGKYSITISRKLLIQIEHWTNLWACNLQNMLSRLAHLRANRARQLRLALTALSTNQWKILAQNVDIGQGSDIHPTAYIEDSVVGENVEIGANSVVRGSLIGDNTVLGNNVNVAHSVLGEHCQLWDGVTITYSLLYPGAFVTSPLINCSVLGRNTFLPIGATITDFRFDGQNVIVLKQGKPYDSGNRFLGACVGHNSYLGSGIVVAPGREIPNNTRIVPNADRVLSNLDKLNGFQKV